MHRIPPSQKIGKKAQYLLKQGQDGEADVTSLVFRLGIERIVQEMVEQDVTDYLEHGHYQRRRPEQEHRGYRNGYEPGRSRTAEGEIVVQVPQVRDAPETYRSRLMVFLRDNIDVLERLVVEMYARGLSTRDIEDRLEEATGDRLLSRTAVSLITEVPWEEYEAFAERDLSSFEVEYLSQDAVYESLRQQGGGKEGVMCACAICADRRKAMLHLALGNKESYQNWLEFLRDMVRRGLQMPVQVTTDGAPGLMRDVEEVFPSSLRQRCLAHKPRNVTGKVPDSVRAEIKNVVRAAYHAPNREVADMIAADVLKTYQSTYPAAMRSLQDDWDVCIAYLRCPAALHKRIRTTNLLERSFLEEPRRTRTIPRFLTEKNCLKLVFATVWRGQPAQARCQNERNRTSATQTPSTRTRIAARRHTRCCWTQGAAACRLTHAAPFAGSSGLDLVRNQQIDITEYKEGFNWIELYRDIKHTILSHKSEDISLRDYTRPHLAGDKAFAVWDTYDMKPFWELTSQKARRSFGKVRGKGMTSMTDKLAASPLFFSR